MTTQSNLLQFTAAKTPVHSMADHSARSGYACQANIGDTRVKHAEGMHEVRLVVCDHHRLVLESLFGLRLRSLKRKK